MPPEEEEEAELPPDDEPPLPPEEEEEAELSPDGDEVENPDDFADGETETPVGENAPAPSAGEESAEPVESAGQPAAEAEKSFDYDTDAVDADAPSDGEEEKFSYDFPDPAPFVAATADDLENLSETERRDEPEVLSGENAAPAAPATALDLESVAEPDEPAGETAKRFPSFALPSFLRLDGGVSASPLKTALASSASYVAGVVSRFKPRAAAEPALPPDHVVVSFSNDADDPYFKG